MFQHVDGFREHERIDVDQLGNIGICGEYSDIVQMPKYILVFAFGRLNNQERDAVLVKFIKNLVYRVTLARSG